jgi:hypothetical protein
MFKAEAPVPPPTVTLPMPPIPSPIKVPLPEILPPSVISSVPVPRTPTCRKLEFVQVEPAPATLTELVLAAEVFAIVPSPVLLTTLPALIVMLPGAMSPMINESGAHGSELS